MQQIGYIKKPRVELVDALRGFELFGILLLHTIDYFDFLIRAEMNPQFFENVLKFIKISLK